MTLPAQRSRRVSKRTGVVLRVCLAVALLVPLGVLFGSNWQTNAERWSFADRERHGIEYLRALGPVTVALVDAQSSAVAGRSGAREALRSAVEGANAVDVRYGAELRTSERWAGLRAKIEALPSQPSDPRTTSRVYGESTDLLLALYTKVREGSGLARDPEADSYNLQDAAADELPEALIAAGRLADHTVIMASRPTADRLTTATDLALARSAVLEPATDLVAGLRAAVQNTTSRTLGGNLLRRLDGYQRAVEALAGLTANAAAVNPIQVGSARSSAHLSGAELSAIILTELDKLVVDRADELAGQRWLAIAALTLALLMIGALVTSTVIAGRPARPGLLPGGTDGIPSGTDGIDGLPPGGARPDPATGTGPPPTGPPIESPLALGTPIAASMAAAASDAQRRSFRPDQTGRRGPSPDWAEPVPAGQVGQSTPGIQEPQPAPWGRPDAG